MTCRAAKAPGPLRSLTARERLEHIDRLSQSLIDGFARGDNVLELQLRALEIQGVACVGAAYERRRERGE